MVITDRAEVVREVCEIVALAYHSIGDYSHASDCFCDDKSGLPGFRHELHSIEFVRQAVLEKLHRSGTPINMEFNPITGRPTSYDDPITPPQPSTPPIEQPRPSDGPAPE